jgi:meiotic recombination protein SPO11
MLEDFIFHDDESFHNDDSSDSTANSILSGSETVSREIVLSRILEFVRHHVLQPLFSPEESEEPQMIEFQNKSFYHSTHCRNLTSILLVASFCMDLLLANKTTTTREVYYFYVTHFFHQKECDKAIWDLCTILKVSRNSLGLSASPKGWFCGCIDLYNDQGTLVLNGRHLDNIHGMPITATTYRHTISSKDAKFILVVEKEGVYTRLAEDQFFRQYHPCILVTGKGFPDVATRQWVRQMAQSLHLPVYGLADCNPYGISVLNSYRYQQVASQRKWHCSSHSPPTNQSLVIQWIGLRPTQLQELELPDSVFQRMTERDKALLNSFLKETHQFHQQGGNPQKRKLELVQLEQDAKKVELEALNWKGMDFLCQWVSSLIDAHDRQCQGLLHKNQGRDMDSDGDGEELPELTNII